MDEKCKRLQDKLAKCKSMISKKIIEKKKLTPIIEHLVKESLKKDCLNHLDTGAIPSRQEIIKIIKELYEITHPGFSHEGILESANIGYHIGSLVNSCFDRMHIQIEKALRHNCLRDDLPCIDCQTKSIETSINFFEVLPTLRETLRQDVKAAFTGDPAARTLDEIVICYPGVYATAIYRFAHLLHALSVPLLPRIMTEHAHSVTGVDIHPGARIGKNFFIDHGTGVVIGETCVIGNNVKIYQGVTLGAKSFPRDEKGELLRDVKRHPELEDDVTIYANATVLGGDVVIGKNSTIGGNVWVTESIPPNCLVLSEAPGLSIREKIKKGTII